MNYQKIYNSIMERGKLRGLNKKNVHYYTERHHIIPKALGGSNKKDNFVLLTPEEHYVAHQLLLKIYPKNYKLAFAAGLMTISPNFVGEGRITNKLYSWIRKKCSNTLSGRTKILCPRAQAISKALSGRTKETHEHIEIQAAQLRGRTKETHEGVARTAEKLSGRTKENDESKRQMSVKITGRTAETHRYIHEKAEKRKILPLEIRHLIYNKKEHGHSVKEIQAFLLTKNYKVSISVIYKTLQSYKQTLRTDN